MTSEGPRPNRLTEFLIIWIAQGFGSGRMRPGPGTWGSLVGILWLLILLVPASPAIFVGGCIFGVLASVLFCDLAEKILKQKDPSHIVIDEICAIPLCFLWWVFARETFPNQNAALDKWPYLVLGFGLFRLFDIWKPWPVRQSQNLRGGVGTTIDDVLAAGYVNLLFYLLSRFNA